MKKDMLQGEQFVISHELLYLLHWLLKYEEVEISKLVNKSFLQGLEEKMQKGDPLSELQMSDEIQNSIVNFFNFMEQEIADIADQESTKLMNKDVMKTLDHLDPKLLDTSTIKTTISKRASKINTKKDKAPKNNFLKELLRQWKPKKEKNKKALLN